MKKSISLLLLFVIIFSMAGCHNATPQKSGYEQEVKINYNTFGEWGEGEYQIIDGELYCRYRNSLGLVGEDVFAHYEDWTKTNVDADNIVHLDVYSGALLYMTSDGKAYGLGDAAGGKFGIKIDEGVNKDIKGPKLLFEDCKFVSLGNCFILFLKNDNTLWFMGESLNGQSTQIEEMFLEPIKIADDIQYAKAFGFTTAWIDGENNLYLCGDNSNGQIGNGTKGNGFPTMREDIVKEPYCALKYCTGIAITDNYVVHAQTSYGTDYVWGGEYGPTPIYANE